VAELRAVAEGGADVEDRVLADEDASADGDGTGLDGTGPGAVAAEVGVLADHAARADRQQVGADGHVLGEDHHAAADPGAQRPQVQHVQRGAHEQPGQRVGDDHRLDEPEPEVGQAPRPDAPRLPAADEEPLGQHRQDAHGQQPAPAEDHQPRVDRASWFARASRPR